MTDRTASGLTSRHISLQIWRSAGSGSVITVKLASRLPSASDPAYLRSSRPNMPWKVPKETGFLRNKNG
jgi:hypothetical protein